MFDFYRTFLHRLPLEPLTHANIDEAAAGKKTLLVYGKADVFPAIAKISIRDLWGTMLTAHIEEMAKRIYIGADFAAVREADAENLPLLIEKFDDGHDAVAIIDGAGNFKSVACLSTLRGHFPKKHFPKWNNLFIEYTPDEEELKRTVMLNFFGTARRELPIVQNGKVVASDRLTDTKDEKMKVINDQPLKIYWDAISDDVAKTIIGENKKFCFLLRNILSINLRLASSTYSRYMFMTNPCTSNIWREILTYFYMSVIFGAKQTLSNILRQIFLYKC